MIDDIQQKVIHIYSPVELFPIGQCPCGQMFNFFLCYLYKPFTNYSMKVTKVALHN